MRQSNNHDNCNLFGNNSIIECNYIWNNSNSGESNNNKNNKTTATTTTNKNMNDDE